MGVADWFRRTSKDAPPEALRERLFALVAAGDRAGLEALCRERRAEIVALFPSWKKVPEGIRGEPESVQRYGKGLIGLATLFAEVLGEPALLEALIGKPEDNPITRWEEGLHAGRALLGEGRFSEAARHLESLLRGGERLQGVGLTRLVIFTLEMLAEARFQDGNAAGAVQPLERALALCREEGDAEGILACAGSLFETQRYLGDFESAARCSEERAAHLGRLGHARESEQARATAARVRAGEPLNRVVAVIDGARFELDEMPAPRSARVKFIFERNRLTPRRASMLTDQGSQLAAEGRYESALARFDAASAVDRFDPQSRFLAGLTLLYLRRYAEASARYREVERLAPGWFHCRADMWMAERLASGALPHAAFVAIAKLEDANLAPAAALRLAEETARDFRLPAAHLHCGRGWLNRSQNEEARSALREGLKLADEPDVRARLSVTLASLVEGAERDALFEAAMDPRGNLVAAAQARVLLRLARQVN